MYYTCKFMYTPILLYGMRKYVYKNTLFCTQFALTDRMRVICSMATNSPLRSVQVVWKVTTNGNATHHCKVVRTCVCPTQNASLSTTRTCIVS